MEPGALELLMEEHVVELGLELLELLDLLMEEHAVELGALEEARQAAITAGSLMASRASRIRGCEAIKGPLNSLLPLDSGRRLLALDSGRRLPRECSGLRALGAPPICRPCRASLK